MNMLSNFLGLCARAGALKTGEAVCEQLAKSGGARLILVDSSASDRSKKSIRDACEYAGIPLVEMEPGSLGQAVGKPGRMAAAVTDRGFADKMIKMAIH
jgi:ribosomal protein L7Ae-like RNA K-turn-binding protein